MHENQLSLKGDKSMPPMTEDRLRELLSVSEYGDSFDSAVVRELFVEVDRLEGVLRQLDLAHLTDALERLPNELAEMEVELRRELVEEEKRLALELAEAKEQCRMAGEIMDPPNPDFKRRYNLLTSCLEHIRRPETAGYIRENLKKIQA